MITPMDLRTKAFRKATVGGYDKRDVDEYMEVLTEDYEKIYKQSVETADKISALTKLLDSYKAMEDTMKNSIIVAQSTAEELQRTSQDKAEVIIDEARLKAKEIIDEANAEVTKINTQLAEMKTAMELYKNSAKGMLTAQLDVLEKFKTE